MNKKIPTLRQQDEDQVVCLVLPNSVPNTLYQTYPLFAILIFKGGLIFMPVYKNEEKNTWYTSFYYTDWTGQRKRKKKEGFARKKDALEYEQNFKARYSGSCTDMTFGQVTALYLEDCKIRQKATSYYVKESGINKHVLPYFQDMLINTITVAHIRQWQNELLNTGKYSENYLRTQNTYLSGIFNYAMKFYGLQKNPAKECGKIRGKRTELQFWTLDQFNAFIETYKGQFPEYPIFLLLFWTGMRSGELLALTLNDFDFVKHTVRINKTYHRLDKEDLILDPKTERSNREVILPPFIEETIKEYVSKLYDYKPSDRLFPTTKYILKHRLDNGAQAAGLPQIRVHDLRHSHASLLIHLGFSPLVIQERLGHENIETTLNTYSHLYPTQQGELAAKLQEVFEK